MPFVERHANGSIIRMLDTAVEGCDEFLAPDHPDVQAHEAVVQEVKNNLQYLNDSDMGVLRVSEDLIELLIERNIIRLTDLPDAAQEKLLKRKSARARVNHLDSILLDEDAIL